ncbi:GNAT family N-acetyltransferase [Nocardiopsis sp. HNM0947]|uniref:GNAT family N-acetyltransferase n=1 Tax=Nocardiopsis coralli TaxID=2772213 RepID=A0ABR9P3P9_9ACTN|nr:GNAT family N-acetyltransferase [Nocardiopsis coralli]MBE2998437.1 GNAT family N-acetyltransferase [Nocardiopsis coralli]
MSDLQEKKMLPSVVLETDRLRLRAFIEDDIDDVLATCSDPDLQKWIPIPAPDTPYTRKDAEEWCREVSPGMRTRGEGQQWAMTEADTGRLVGAIGLLRVSWAAMNGELGYWSSPWARNRGYMTEAVVAVSRWALDQGFRRVEIKAATGNAPSRSIPERTGYTFEGVERSAMPGHGGTRYDLAVYSLLPSDPRP